MVFYKVSSGKTGFKYFTDYKNAKNVRPLCIFLPKTSAFRRDFDETKYTSLLIKDDELFEKYNQIREKVENSLKKEFQWATIQYKIFILIVFKYKMFKN